jgi:hypothetical protein
METITNPMIPASWCTLDIRVGSLTIHLDEENFLKGAYSVEDYDNMTLKFDNYLKSNGSQGSEIQPVK